MLPGRKTNKYHFSFDECPVNEAVYAILLRIAYASSENTGEPAH